MWLTLYPQMRSETYISFDQFKEMSIKQKTTNISYDKIENEFEDIVKNDKLKR